MRIQPTLLALAIALSFLAAVAASAGCIAPYMQPIALSDRQAAALATPDLDGDGRPDIAGLTATAVFVLRNDGKDGFGKAADVYSGSPRGPLLTADFNGDGRADLAFARDGALVVLPGKGDGTFGTPIESAIAIQPTLLVLGRFGSNAAIDLVALDAAAAKLVVFRNNGAGSFAESQTIAIRTNATVMTAADLDADGKTDIVAGYGNRGTFDVFYGRGNGFPDPAVTMAGSSLAIVLRSADFDGNGLADLAYADGFGRVAVIRNLGGRAFGDPLVYAVFNDSVFNSTYLADMVPAELTGDGKADLLSSGSCGIRTSTGSGTGTLTRQWFADPPKCYNNFLPRGSVAAADFDGDGRVDAVAGFVRSDGGVIEFRNLCGDGVLTATNESPTISAGQSVAIAVNVRPPVSQDFWLPASGSVSLLEGSGALATATLSPLSAATLTAGNLPLGDHTLIVRFAGDQQYNPMQSPPLVVHVTTATTTTTLAPDPASLVYGQIPKFTATVTASAGDTPTGPIRFTFDGKTLYDGSSSKAPKATANGPTTVGEHTVVAEFVGDATHPPSKATLTYVVAKQTPKIDTVTKSGVAGQAIPSFAMAVRQSGGGEIPTGTLTLRIGDTVLGTRSLGSPVSFALPALDAGRVDLRAAYSGDQNFSAADTIIPFVVFPQSPPSLDARAGADGTVLVTWHGPDHIYLSRKVAGQAWSGRMCCSPGPFVDTVSPETVYLYRSESGDHSSLSTVDVAMFVPFSDDPLLPERSATPAHLDEVVRAANILRRAAALPAVSLPPVTPASGRRRAIGVAGVPAGVVPLLRNAINEARDALGAYRFPFTAPIAAGTTVNGAQLQELREAIR